VERGAGVFENRGDDALLAARCPNNNAADWAHLASFIRTGLEQQTAPALAHCIGCTQTLSGGTSRDKNRCVFDRTPHA
jgi:hypothetical protein